jgi:hypothetical protein
VCDPSPDSALGSLGCIDHCYQLEVRIAERHDPVSGAPRRMTTALDGRQAVTFLELLPGLGQVRHGYQYVVEFYVHRSSDADQWSRSCLLAT